MYDRDVSGLWLPSPLAEERGPLQGISPWLQYSELGLGGALPFSDLCEWFKRLDRRATLVKLARLAAVVANSPGGASGTEAASWSRDLLVSRRDSVNPREALVAEAVARRPNRVIVHDEVIHFAQALCLLYGKDNGKVPADGLLAYLLLAANDYTRAALPAANLSPKEALASGFMVTTLFNRHEDIAISMARIAWIMSSPPMSGPLKASETWKALQVQAFGKEFVDYFDFFLGPLTFLSRLWGTEKSPVFDFRCLVQTDVVLPAEQAGWMAHLMVGLDEARDLVLKGSDGSGVPRAPIAIAHRPLVQLSDTSVVAINPGLLPSQLNLGVWHKCNTAAKLMYGDSGNQIWTAAFGDRFEAHCRRVARMAQDSPSFVGRLWVADQPGRGEVEDIALDYGQSLVLVSVKASTVPAAAARQAASERSPIDFLHRFFFAHPKKGFRGGVIRLLHASIDRVRTGIFDADGIVSTAQVIPIVVTFDEFSDGVGLYSWIDEMCVNENLLNQNNVLPITVMRVDHLECLLAAAARGLHVAEFLQRKLGSQQRHVRIDRALASEGRSGRLDQLHAEFENLTDRVQARLFRTSVPSE